MFGLDHVTPYIEAPIDNWMASFDGRVLEIFTPYTDGSMRCYVGLLVGFEIDGNTLTAGFLRLIARSAGGWVLRRRRNPGRFVRQRWGRYCYARRVIPVT